MLFHYHVTHEVREHMNFTLQMKDLFFRMSLKQNSVPITGKIKEAVRNLASLHLLTCASVMRHLPSCMENMLSLFPQSKVPHI